jgi:hypothetical protein
MEIGKREGNKPLCRNIYRYWDTKAKLFVYACTPRRQKADRNGGIQSLILDFGIKLR